LLLFFHRDQSVNADREIKVVACDSLSEHINTGRFIMYSGITKIYYRKPIGHVFMNPVQIEGTTETFIPQ
jgi:hypothetical protein